jgi:hypothetical protein
MIAFFSMCVVTNAQVESTEVTIEGIVTDSRTNAPLNQAKVEAQNKDNGTVFDNTYTNSSGYYNMTFLYTGLDEDNAETPVQKPLEDRLYPNPFSKQTNIETCIQHSGDYTLLISGLDGRQYLKTDIKLKEGNNKITLTGGNKGILLINLFSSEESHNYKALNLSGTDIPFSFDISYLGKANSQELKSTLDEGDDIFSVDSVRIVYTKDGYYPKDTVVEVVSYININMALDKIPEIVDFTLKPFTVNGEASPVDLTVEWTDGTSDTYPTQNGEIHVYKELYTPSPTLTLTHDTINTLEWTIIREPQQKTNRPNVAQNPKQAGLPPEDTQAPLDSLNNRTLYLYLIPKEVEGPNGTLYRMDDPTVSGMMVNFIGKTIKFNELPVTVADSMHIVQKSWNETTGQQMPEVDLNNAWNQQTKVVNLAYISNTNDTLFPPFMRYRAYSTSDPRWQELIARDFENSARTTFYNGTPGNGIETAVTYTYNNTIRIKTSSSKYNNVATNGQIIEEIYQQFSAITEMGGGLAGWILSGTPSDPYINELGQTMFRTTLILDNNTYYSYAEKKK